MDHDPVRTVLHYLKVDIKMNKCSLHHHEFFCMYFINDVKCRSLISVMFLLGITIANPQIIYFFFLHTGEG